MASSTSGTSTAGRQERRQPVDASSAASSSSSSCPFPIVKAERSAYDVIQRVMRLSQVKLRSKRGVNGEKVVTIMTSLEQIWRAKHQQLLQEKAIFAMENAEERAKMDAEKLERKVRLEEQRKAGGGSDDDGEDGYIDESMDIDGTASAQADEYGKLDPVWLMFPTMCKGENAQVLSGKPLVYCPLPAESWLANAAPIPTAIKRVSRGPVLPHRHSMRSFLGTLRRQQRQLSSEAGVGNTGGSNVNGDATHTPSAAADLGGDDEDVDDNDDSGLVGSKRIGNTLIAEYSKRLAKTGKIWKIDLQRGLMTCNGRDYVLGECACTFTVELK